MSGGGNIVDNNLICYGDTSYSLFNTLLNYFNDVTHSDIDLGLNNTYKHAFSFMLSNNQKEIEIYLLFKRITTSATILSTRLYSVLFKSNDYANRHLVPMFYIRHRHPTEPIMIMSYRFRDIENNMLHLTKQYKEEVISNIYSTQNSLERATNRYMNNYGFPIVVNENTSTFTTACSMSNNKPIMRIHDVPQKTNYTSRPPSDIYNKHLSPKYFYINFFIIRNAYLLLHQTNPNMDAFPSIFGDSTSRIIEYNRTLKRTVNMPEYFKSEQMKRIMGYE